MNCFGCHGMYVCQTIYGSVQEKGCVYVILHTIRLLYVVHCPVLHCDAYTLMCICLIMMLSPRSHK